MRNKTKLMVYIEIDENDSVSVSVENLDNYYMGGVIPPYEGELNRSIQSPNWLSCSTDPAMESWYITYVE